MLLRTIKLAIAIGAAVAALTTAVAAQADVTQTIDGNLVTVTLVGAVTDSDDNVFVPTDTPTVKITANDPSTTIGSCSVDDGNTTPCGTQQASGCPAHQCWAWTPRLQDGDGDVLTIEVDDTELPSTLWTIDLTGYAEPPHTALETPPDPDFDFGAPKEFEYPSFTYAEANNPVPITYQCSLSSGATAPSSWGSCKLPRLKVLGIYRFAVRGVDIFGRTDPAPPQYVFSPTPCRATVKGRLPTMAHILAHGLAVTAMCVQPSRFETEFNLPPAYVENLGIPSPYFGVVKAKTTRPLETLHLKVAMLRGIPAGLKRFLAAKPHVPVQLLTFSKADYGADYLHPYTARGS